MKNQMNEGQKVIVLVEDTEALRNAISNVLIQNKYHVEAFEDTDSAIAFLAMHKAGLLNAKRKNIFIYVIFFLRLLIQEKGLLLFETYRFHFGKLGANLFRKL